MHINTFWNAVNWWSRRTDDDDRNDDHDDDDCDDDDYDEKSGRSIKVKQSKAKGDEEKIAHCRNNERETDWMNNQNRKKLQQQ